MSSHRKRRQKGLDHRFHPATPKPTLYARTVRSKTQTISRRKCGGRKKQRMPFEPPEEWHEPAPSSPGYEIHVRSPGEGYRHVVSPEDIRLRLTEVPPRFIDELQHVHLAAMTKKKLTYPCYGMQWGATVYLYPMEEDLVERYYEPPEPWKVTESQMYGGRWEEGDGEWLLIWTEQTIKDFYLNNILIHELGHLVDNHNQTSDDREAYAEWFAVEYGYRRTQKRRRRNKKKRIRRRHHAC